MDEWSPRALGVENIDLEGAQGTSGGNENVLFLDPDGPHTGAYISQNLLMHTLK